MPMAVCILRRSIPMRECWKKLYKKNMQPAILCGVVAMGVHAPEAEIDWPMTIPELLEQADMVRMAVYDYESGYFITPTPAENPMNMNFGVYIYPKLHTFHELQNPKGDLI
jgi:hypothetical protein